MSLRSVAHQLLDSPFDGNLYGRENGAWVTVPSSSGGMAEAPTDGQLYGRRGSTASWLPVVAVASGVPASPANNQLWWDSTDGNLYLWFNDGTSTQWVPAVATAAAAGGPYLPTSGGVLTGALTLAGDATANLQPTTLQQLNASLSGYATQQQLPVRSVLDWLTPGQPDGTTNNSAQIQAAVDNCAGKWILVFPVTASPYIVSGLGVHTNSQICINGTIRLANGVPNGGILQIDRNASNVSIYGTGTLDGNAANQTNVIGGITSAGNGASSNVVIRDITIINSKNWPINITNCTNGLVENVTMNGGGNSVEFALNSTNCWFVGCSVANITDLGIGFYGGPSRCGVVRCDVSGCNNGPFALSDNGQSAQCTDLLFAENTVHGNNGGGIILSTNVTGQINMPLRTRIVGNTCFSNTGPGINVGASTYTLVEGNICHDNSYTAANPGDIVLGTATRDASVTSNLIFSAQQGSTLGFGIYLNLPIHVSVTNNRIEDRQTTQTMNGAIGGTTGPYNTIAGNTYGPTINAPDQLNYANSSTQGFNYDAAHQLVLTGAAGTISGNLTQTSGGLLLQSANQALLMGSQTVSNTPYIDFYSAGHSTRDLRLLASGGTGAGDGVLTLMGNLLVLQTTYGFRMPKVAAATPAPGAGYAQLQFMPGTNAGTAKLVAYAGTSTTPVTIMDNIGAGF